MGKYEEIINLPHHVSEKHKSMARIDRAAQFAPFAALTGFEDAIDDEAKISAQNAIPETVDNPEINNIFE